MSSENRRIAQSGCTFAPRKVPGSCRPWSVRLIAATSVHGPTLAHANDVLAPDRSCSQQQSIVDLLSGVEFGTARLTIGLLEPLLEGGDPQFNSSTRLTPSSALYFARSTAIEPQIELLVSSVTTLVNSVPVCLHHDAIRFLAILVAVPGRDAAEAVNHQRLWRFWPIHRPYQRPSVAILVTNVDSRPASAGSTLRYS